jgi:hypothetical protein
MPITFIAVRRELRADGWLVVGTQMFPARSGRNLSDVPPERLRAEEAKKNRKLRPGEHKYIDFAAERGDIPPGTYTIGEGMRLSADNQLTMTPGGPTSSRYKKFPIIPTGATRMLSKDGKTVLGTKDPRYSTARTSLLFHFDGDVEGSAGCIVYDDIKVQEALEAMYQRKDRAVEVIHVATPEIAKAQADALLKQRIAARAS